MPKKRDNRAVIFDLGGVLLRTEDYGPRHKWDRRLGLTLGTVESVVHGIEEWRQAQLGAVSIHDYWQAVAGRLKLNPWELDDLQDDFYAGDRFDMKLISMIRGLRRDSVKIGLLSNNTGDVVDQLTVLNLRSLFDECIISSEIGAMKPDPAAYLAILDRFKFPPEQTLFVDDVLENVLGARACGMVSIQFSSDTDLETAIRDWLDGGSQAG